MANDASLNWKGKSMHNGTWFAVLCVAGAGVLAACGDSGSSSTSTTGTSATTTTTGTGGSSTTSTTASTTSTTGAGGAGGSSTTSTTSTTGAGGDGGSGPVLVNNCDEATAVDHTADLKVQIDFGGAAGFKYSPPCLIMKAGSSVSFAGDFASHPLSGGVDGTKDPASPIKDTNSGNSASFALPSAGTFGFFCQFHQAGGMKGAIFVK